MGVGTGTASQVNVEDFDYMVNALNNCYECNTQRTHKEGLSKPRQPRLTYTMRSSITQSICWATVGNAISQDSFKNNPFGDFLQKTLTKV